VYFIKVALIEYYNASYTLTDSYKILTKGTREEQELLKSLHSGEWESIENLENERKHHQKIAKNTLKLVFCINMLVVGWYKRDNKSPYLITH
jgi:hypothetical protein